MSFWKVMGFFAVGVATGGAGFYLAPAIGAAASAVGIGVGGGALSGAAATSAGLAAIGGGSVAAGGFGVAGGTAIITGLSAAFGSCVTAACSAFESGQIEAGREELAKMARMDREAFRRTYEASRSTMRPEVRAEWEKFL